MPGKHIIGVIADFKRKSKYDEELLGANIIGFIYN